MANESGAHILSIPTDEDAPIGAPRPPLVLVDDDEIGAVRTRKFYNLLAEDNINLDALKKLSWSGIPDCYRPMVWQVLLGYLPVSLERRESVVQRKRKEYFDAVREFVNIDDSERTEYERGILKQIQADVPRTHPTLALYRSPIIQAILERVLYVWSIRHPASGYVQGINDLATPFLTAFLNEYVVAPGEAIYDCDVASVDPDVLLGVEADAFWCLTKLLDRIQDNYTFGQPGIQRMMYSLESLAQTMNSKLCDHLKEKQISFIMFSFRWMNCLLLREFSHRSSFRLFDTYLSQVEDFSSFHVYVCAAFLVSFADHLRSLDTNELMMALQCLPSNTWTSTQVDVLLSEAYVAQSLYKDAPAHLVRHDS